MNVPRIKVPLDMAVIVSTLHVSLSSGWSNVCQYWLVLSADELVFWLWCFLFMTKLKHVERFLNSSHGPWATVGKLWWHEVVFAINEQVLSGGNVSDFYLEGSCFRSWLGHWLSELRVLGVFLSPSGQTPRQFLRLRYDFFFSHPFQDIIHCDSTVWCCALLYIDRIVK
jgi:hypothetical protein